MGLLLTFGRPSTLCFQKAPLTLTLVMLGWQHYEIPPEFYFPIMGKRLKYSACLFPAGMHDDDIDGAEVAALKQVEERAGLANGQHVLELGCGWGSLVSGEKEGPLEMFGCA